MAGTRPSRVGIRVVSVTLAITPLSTAVATAVFDGTKSRIFMATFLL